MWLLLSTLLVTSILLFSLPMPFAVAFGILLYSSIGLFIIYAHYKEAREKREAIEYVEFLKTLPKDQLLQRCISIQKFINMFGIENKQAILLMHKHIFND